MSNFLRTILHYNNIKLKFHTFLPHSSCENALFSWINLHFINKFHTFLPLRRLIFCLGRRWNILGLIDLVTKLSSYGALHEWKEQKQPGHFKTRYLMRTTTPSLSILKSRISTFCGGLHHWHKYKIPAKVTNGQNYLLKCGLWTQALCFILLQSWPASHLLSVLLVTSQQHHLQRLNLKELKVWSSLFDTDERTEKDAINQTIVQEEENDPHICRDSNSTQPCCLYRDEGGDWRLHGEARWFILLSTEQNYVVLHLYLMTTGYIVDYQNCQLLWGTRRKLQHIIKLRESTEPRETGSLNVSMNSCYFCQSQK